MSSLPNLEQMAGGESSLLRAVPVSALRPAESRAEPQPARAKGRQALVLFAALLVVGAALLSLPAAHRGGRLSVPDAVFLATSAVTLTGLSPVPVSELTAAGQILLLVLFQSAGVAIILFSTLCLACPGTHHARNSRRVVRSCWPEVEQLRPARLLRDVALLTVALEAAGALVLYGYLRRSGAAHPAFEAVFHAASAFCNAGFATAQSGIEGLFPAGPAWIVLLVLVSLGGLGYAVLRDVLRRVAGGKRSLDLHTRIVLLATLLLIAGGTALLLLFERSTPAGIGPGRRPLLGAAFQAVSARSAGFNLSGRSPTPAGSAVTVLLMLVGGAPGSTAGGLRITTVFLVLLVVLKSMDPRGNRLPLAPLRVKPQAQLFAVVFLLRALAALACATGLLAATETLFNHQAGLSFGEILFETVSAFTASGLSSGATVLLSDPGKLVLVLTMLTGRLGLLAMAARMSGLCSAGGVPGERHVLREGEVLLGA